MEKVYQPQELEQRLYTTWENKGYFQPRGNGPVFSVVIPPPNVTGALHMGHALNSTLQDMMVRYKRMKGFRTVWIPGTDHAGISTQNVVEKKLAKEGRSRFDMSREAFIDEVWQWKKEYGNRITTQFRRLGASVDWSRERFTMDEQCATAVVENFVSLYEKGYIYQGHYIINWCPRCETALSDIEVNHEDCEGHLWLVNYPGKDNSEGVVIATTRPETMFGDTAVAVHPDDERYHHLIGKSVVLPFSGRVIPVIADTYVDPTFGTGVVKITPAHDANDFEVGKRHNLPQILAYNEKAIMNENAPVQFQGLDRFACREKLVESLKEHGFLKEVRSHGLAKGQCYRCKTIIEPYLSKQWFVSMKELVKKPIESIRNREIRFIPERWESHYFEWMENIRDWCISRQIWWGHRIPVWYCENHKDKPIVSRTTPETCPHCDNKNLVQDEDVLDTWFSSALWPFSTFGWPNNKEELAMYYPTSLLVTGYDILTFWVSRMITMGYFELKEKPFQEVYIHGLVRDITGKKMSKSIGNVIDPLELIEQFGTDALRFSLASLTTLGGQDIRFSSEKVESSRNFANKLWNASRFLMMSFETLESPLTITPSTFPKTIETQWILSQYAATVATVNNALETYNYALATESLWEFIWNVWCDWYIEISKLNKAETLPVSAFILINSLKLLHPIMPFITEEIWQRLGEVLTLDHETIMYASWPEEHPEWLNPEIDRDMGLIIQVIRECRNLRSARNIPPSKLVDLILVVPQNTSEALLSKTSEMIQKLAKVETLTITSDLSQKPEQALSSVVQNIELFIPLSGLVNADDERDRLQKHVAQLTQELVQLELKLNNPQFCDKAPQAVVDGIRQKAKIAQDEKLLLEAQIQQLA